MRDKADLCYYYLQHSTHKMREDQYRVVQKTHFHSHVH